MLKIVCLIRSQPSSIYFVNKINESQKIHLVILESFSLKRKIFSRFRDKGFLNTIDELKDIFLKKVKGKKYNYDYERYFDNKWHAFDQEIPVWKTHDINAKSVAEKLQIEKPDLLLVYGTSLVRREILESAPLALNLHWGLSPYYRGVYCTEWAILNRDPYNIGVTVHKLSGKIDGGDILAQRRATIGSQDTMHSINMQLTKLGTGLIIETINKIMAGNSLSFRSQDYSLGFLIRKSQWNRHLRRLSESIVNKKCMENMLKNPSRNGKLPIFSE